MRLIKTPNLQLLDSDLRAALQGGDIQSLSCSRLALGALLECFVCGELR